MDRYLKNPSDNLTEITEDTNFYALTVAWRILYDDLYVHCSYPNDSERTYLEEYGHKLRRFLYGRYLKEKPEDSVVQQIYEMLDLVGKCFGKIIAEIEKYHKINYPKIYQDIKD